MARLQVYVVELVEDKERSDPEHKLSVVTKKVKAKNAIDARNKVQCDPEWRIAKVSPLTPVKEPEGSEIEIKRKGKIRY